MSDSNMVDHPQHYNTGAVECIDGIIACMSKDELKGFYKGNAIKYLWRSESKGAEVEDLKKAQWYIGRLICLLREKENER